VSIGKLTARRWWFVVFGAAFVSLLLTLAIGLPQSVWFDEHYSIMLAQRPLAELLALTQVDAHPPLYYIYLKLWGSVFGWSDLALRLSSIIPAALTVVFVALATRRLFNPKVALVVLPFLVLSPMLVRYGFEIRMYALIGLLAAIGTYVLLRAHADERARWWLLYAFIVAAAMYTLYMSVIIWAGHMVWLIYHDVRSGKNPFKQKRWLYLATAILVFLPWVPSLIYQLTHSALPPSLRDIDLLGIVNIASLMMTYTPSWRSSALLLGLIGITFGLLFWLTFKAFKAGDKKQRLALMLPIIGFFGIAGLYITVAILTPQVAFTERYIVPILFLFSILLGAVIALTIKTEERWRAVALGALTLGLFVYGNYTLFTVGNYNFQRLQPAYADIIKRDIGCENTTIVTSGAYGYIDLGYAFRDCDFRYYQPAGLTYVGGYAPLNALSTTKRVKDGAALISPYVAFIYYDDSTEFIDMGERYRLERQLEYTGLHIRIYRSDS